MRRPQSNDFIELLHRTLLDEHFRIAERAKWYESVEEMQKDFDAFLVTYNEKRPHQGRLMEGRTPLAMFKRGIPKARPAASADTMKLAA